MESGRRRRRGAGRATRFLGGWRNFKPAGPHTLPPLVNTRVSAHVVATIVGGPATIVVGRVAAPAARETLARAHTP